MATIRPTRCTSITARCDPRTARHCPRCSHAEYSASAVVDGRTYRLEFNPLFGPRFWNARGRELASPRAALWRRFQAWHDKHFGREG
jgi:hypothetical protein